MSKQIIKMAYMVATPEITGSDVLAYRGDLKEVFQLMADLGYQGVELTIKDASVNDPFKIGILAREFGLEIPAICTGELYGEDKLSFSDPDMYVRNKAIQRMKGILEFASYVGAFVNIGRLRGRFVDGIPHRESLEMTINALQNSLEYAKRLGVNIVIEPVNRRSADFILTTTEAIAWIELLGKPNCKLMLDVAHMYAENENLRESFFMAKKHLLHVHIADSNRLPPGMGNFDFDRIFDYLREIGYDRYISAEIQQFPDKETALKRTAEFIKGML